MTIASGVAKQVKYKREAVYGTIPSASGAQLLRRVTSSFQLDKDTYQSNEINSHRQVVDMRHGTRRVSTATIDDELSLTTYQDFFAAALRKEWVSGATTGSVSTIAADNAGKTFTRSAGSFFTDGFKIGDVVRWTGWTAAANNDVNYRIVNLTETVMTVAEDVVTESEGSTVTGTVAGKKLWCPTTGHTDVSFSIEEWYSDISQSEVFSGLKINQIEINLPPTGMATIKISFLGQNMTGGTSEYFTSPTPETTTAVLSAVNGSLRLAGTDSAVVTGLNFTINCNANAGDPTVGSNYIPFISMGRLTVTGQFTVYFEDEVMRNHFLDEDEIGIICKLDAGAPACGTSNTTDCIVFNMSRIKLMGSTKDDGEKGLIQTVPFTAVLENCGGAGTALETTTISIQDTSL